MKRLNELVSCSFDTLIKGIKTNSQKVKKGDLFVCIHGLNFDRHDFIEDAVKKGAAAIVVDQKVASSVPIVMVENTNEELLKICDRFYNHPAQNLKFIGVTGTDGKTTTTSMIYQLLKNNRSIAYIGTNGVEFDETTLPTNNTTPLPEELYPILSDIKQKGGQIVAMEVSSEALLHHRVDHLSFDVTILTNITEDHLNIHKDLASYVKAKGRLFTLTKEEGICILNRDDEHFEDMKSYCQNQKIYTYGTNKESDFKISDIIEGKTTTFKITYQKNVYEIESPYAGKYNVFNLTAAIAAVHLLESIKIKHLLASIKKMQPIKGRGEFLDFGQNYTLVLDYAHTENAIKNVLTMVKKKKPHHLLTVTGSAGGREKEKRRAMGKAALELSDLVIFTMDDPRFEDVNTIIDDLIGDYKNGHYKRIPDREEAITYALSNAKENDAVVILGKGRDPYMAIRDQYLPYCDYDVIKSYFDQKKK